MKNSIVFKTSLIIMVALLAFMSSIGLYIENSQANIVNKLQTNQKQYITTQLNRSEKNAIAKEIEILNNLTSSISGALSDSLYNMDESVAQETFEQFLKKDNIKAIYVFDNSENTIFLASFKENNKIVFTKELPKRFKKLESLPKFELVKDEEKLGFVKVFYNNDSIIKSIAILKEKDLGTFYKQSKEIKEKTDQEMVYQIIAFVVVSFIIIFIIVMLLIKFVNQPLVEFQRGLKSFFDYLEVPSKKVEKINIDTNDEFGQMTKSVNESIKVSMKMHGEMAQLMNAMDINVITSETDDKGIITYVSQAFCKISGYSKEELIGKSHSIMQHPDMGKSIFEDMWKTLKDDMTWEGEIKNLKKDGTFYWVHTIISPKCTKAGGSCGFTAIRYDITDKKEVEDLTVNLEIKIEERTADLNIAKKEIEATHKHTRESIEYAALIQGAVLPDYKLLANYFQDYFVHWMPKDTVGGDIWLFNELRHKDECLLFFIDCTGHGVPGAFVTMIVKAIEREIVSKIMEDKEMEISPAWIMGYFNRTMKVLLKQETKDSKSNAGWDGGVIYYNKETQILKFAGAETPLFYIDENKEFQTIKGNRYSVGYKKCAMDYEYKETIIPVKEGMKFYCTTDGYLDQNGGEKDFPFSKKRFGNIIKDIHTKPMIEQKEIFISEMYTYETMIENNDRNDDMTVIAFEIGAKL